MWSMSVKAGRSHVLFVSENNVDVHLWKLIESFDKYFVLFIQFCDFIDCHLYIKSIAR